MIPSIRLFLLLIIAAPHPTYNRDIYLDSVHPSIKLAKIEWLEAEVIQLSYDLDCGGQSDDNWFEAIVWLHHLFHTHKDCPPSADLNRFPPHHVCNANLKFCRKVLEELDSQIVWCEIFGQKEAIKKLSIVRDKVMFRIGIWERFTLITDPLRSISHIQTQVRIYLDIMKCELGREAYYNGPIEILPYELFKEIPYDRNLLEN